MTNKYTPEQLDWLRDNRKKMGISELTEKFNVLFDSERSKDAIHHLCIRYRFMTGRCGRFRKGNKPWNTGKKGLQLGGRKTQFKPGDMPKNYVPVGSLRIRSKDFYVDIKTADPNVWTPYHHLIYQRAYGPIPPGHMVIFRDGNKHNLHYQNLVAVTRAELARINKTMGRENLHPQLKPSVVAWVQVEQKIKTVQQNADTGQ